MRRALALPVAAFLAASAIFGCFPSPERRARERREARKNELRTAMISDPKTFNPILLTDSASADAVFWVFEGLVRLDPVTEEPEPLLAESWEHDETGTVWTFRLRRDVFWHDGRPFRAADVAFTLRAIYSDRVPNSYKHILLVDGKPIRTEVVDDHTIRFLLPRPFAPLLNSIGFGIVPKHVLEGALAQGAFAEQWGIDTPPEKLVGTGPYRIVKYVPAQYIQYERNENYWMRDEQGRKLPYLPRRTVLIVPNQDTSSLKFLAGQTDILSPRPEEIFDLEHRADALGIRVERIGWETGIRFVVFNRNPRHYVRGGKRDPRLDWFTDKTFLRALAHAIDKESMIRNCLSGHGRPAVAYISPENKLFHHPGLRDYEYDLEKARALLREGGYVDRDGDGIVEDRKGNRVEFTLHTNAGNRVREKMCAILKEDWSRLGIRVHYRPLEFTTLVEKLSTTFDWDAVLLGFTGGLEPHTAANILRSSGNLHVWNPRQPEPATEWEREIDELVEAGSREMDPEKRRAIYWRIQEILHEELPLLPTVRDAQYVAYRSDLVNFEVTVWGVRSPERVTIAP
ncbi:MAG: ABC transporter substrate-binding protein [Candidatus Binatia bacterium]|nr:MAG: ABC transporter substrate-binding protein [Candidatus Binatia bacterium]